MRRYIIKLIQFSLPLILIVGGFNVGYDPGEVFFNQDKETATNMINGTFSIKRAVPSNWAGIHENYLSLCKKNNHYPSFMTWGSSRNSEIKSKHFSISSYHNIILPGSTIVDYVALIGMFENNHRYPDTLILNIDPWTFYNRSPLMFEGEQVFVPNPNSKLSAGYNMYKYFLIGASILNINVNEIETEKVLEASRLEKLKHILSPSYFQSSIKNFRKPTFKKEEELYKPGYFIIRADGGYSLGKWNNSEEFKEATRKVALKYKKASGDNLFCESCLAKPYFNYFEKTIKYLQKKDIKIYIFISPVHPQLYPSEDPMHETKMETKILDFCKKEQTEVIGSFNPYRYPDLIKHVYFIDAYHLSTEGMDCILNNYSTKNRI